ncbi:MAG: hypothetical protein K8T26_12370 [Lentisphaerae bacterium]|nr:hypothetical protein [Lentisphaerota bacterium]
MSKRKGAAGEREAAAKLNEVLGTHLHRGRQYHGGPESPDLAGDLPGLHLEVKRCERLRLYEGLSQARRDAATDEVPAVMHRANNKPWVIVVEVELLIRLLDVVDACRARLQPAMPTEPEPGGAAVVESVSPPSREATADLRGGDIYAVPQMSAC